jgi:hypothetical protein
MSNQIKKFEKYFGKEEMIKIPKGRAASLDFPCWYDSEAGNSFSACFYNPPDGYRFYVVSKGEHKGKIIYLEDIKHVE